MAFIRLRQADLDFQIHDAKSLRLLHPANIPVLLGGKMGITPNKRLIVSALSGITLDIEDGARLGLIGHNGSGKSSLLRLLAGIYHPTRGTAEREGRISPMFNIGLGMSDEFTGYENIKMSGLLFGMTPEEIEEATPEIEEFSQLGDYLNLPVRTYSDGMRARLSFSIATAKMPEILLLDEWIGAGDAAFQERVAERLKDLMIHPSIIVIASHSADVLKQHCSTAIVLEQGQIKFHGAVDEATAFYMESIKPK